MIKVYKHTYFCIVRRVAGLTLMQVTVSHQQGGKENKSYVAQRLK